MQTTQQIIPFDPRKPIIYNFIIRTFPESDWERSVNFNGICSNFKNYEAFLRHQYQTIVNLDDPTLSFIENLINFIPHISIIDKEDMVDFSASGFFFYEGKVIMFHER